VRKAVDSKAQVPAMSEGEDKRPTPSQAGQEPPEPQPASQQDPAAGDEAEDATQGKAKKLKKERPKKEKHKKDKARKEKKEAAEKPERKPHESRFPRLRKKKDMPGGLWLKCESCGEMMYKKELEERRRVCPSCGFHFTLPGRERIAMLIDPGTWEERYASLRSKDRLHFIDRGPYMEKIENAERKTHQTEALICGAGEIDGREIVLAVLDFSFMGGSMGEVVGEKIALAAELAGTLERPLIIFTSSGGARMHEGVISLMQMAKTSAALADFNDAGGFSICIMTHPTTGGVTASFASVCDITLAEPGALIGFAGPRVIANTIKQELPPGFQRSEFLLAKGQLDRIVQRDHMREELARLIDYGTAGTR
jgi:acetyl-CoA carboxylase carboxyl transferase subunit beta